MSVTTEYRHIVLNDNGVPVIEGTRIKVKYLAIDHVGSGMSPEEIESEFPPLTLGQIHSALAYYFDHKAEIDAENKRDYKYVQEQRALQDESPLIKRLRALRLEQEQYVSD
jgi:uncharacterized protein (DUF433 family)